MDRNIIFSIIIPVFNTPKEYLERNVQSILKQKFEYYEIIIVDDGSDEIYRSFLEELENKDIRITVVYKTHSGVSATRNKGIELAKGKYVIFLDADDIIDEYFFAEAAKIMENYKYPDMIIGGLEYVPYQKCNDTQYGESIEVYKGKRIDLLKKSLMHIRDKEISYFILGSPCGRLYKKNLVEKVLFNQKVSFCEDQIFNRQMLYLAQNIVIVPSKWYYYIQNDFSTTHTKVREDFLGMIKPYWEELLKLDALESEELKESLKGFYVRSYYNMVSNYCKNKNLKITKKIDIMKEASKEKLILYAINGLKLNSKIPLDRKLEWLLLKLHLYYLIYLMVFLLKI